MLLGISLIALWTRLRIGEISLHSPIAEAPNQGTLEARLPDNRGCAGP
jgi:hypothetical protein